MKKIIGVILLVIFGLYGLYIDFSTLNYLYGFSGVMAGLFLAPLTYVGIPVYLFFNGYYLPLILIFGGTIVGGLLYNSGEK
jgi:hypothetical protein